MITIGEGFIAHVKEVRKNNKDLEVFVSIVDFRSYILEKFKQRVHAVLYPTSNYNTTGHSEQYVNFLKKILAHSWEPGDVGLIWYNDMRSWSRINYAGDDCEWEFHPAEENNAPNFFSELENMTLRSSPYYSSYKIRAEKSKEKETI